jgi:FkbM family methyltransferase
LSSGRLRDTARDTVRTALLAASPAARAAFDHRGWRKGVPYEAALYELLAPADRVAVDVGANQGAVSWLLARRCRQVVAFEPLPEFRYLEQALPAHVRFRPVALGDTPGVASLRVPRASGRRLGQLATLSTHNALQNLDVDILEVPVCTLDDELPTEDVGLLKVDVEGHELAVLRGALGLLRRCHPRLVVECEERHAPDGVAQLVALLRPLGYQGYFLLHGVLTPIAQFRRELHQQESSITLQGVQGVYANCFVFLWELENATAPTPA